MILTVTTLDLLTVLVVNEAERVIASNVFEEVSFPSMSAGRVALLGDGKHAPHLFPAPN